MKYLLPFIIFLAISLPHLGQGDYRRDTVRYAAISHYIYSGGDFLAPEIRHGKPYFNKPPLGLWIHGFYLKIFGISIVNTRIPSIIAACLVILVSTLLMRELSNTNLALISACILALSYEFFRRVREISLDMWQLFFILAGFYLIINFKTKFNYNFILGGASIGFALLCKPFVALSIYIIFFLINIIYKRKNQLIWILIFSIPATIVVALPWHYYMFSVFGEDFLNTYFGSQITERMLGKADFVQKKSFFFYFQLIFAGYWPWLIAVAWAIWYYLKSFKKRTNKNFMKYHHAFEISMIWSLIIILSLSFFPDKKVNYLLPIYPFLSWLASFGIGNYFKNFDFLDNKKFQFITSASFIFFAILIHFLPIKFHSPADVQRKQHYQKMSKLKKTEQKPIDFTDNEICYFYLKFSYWPIINKNKK